MSKPDGLTVVMAQDAEVFLESLPIRKIPGIGPKTEAVFQKRGVVLVRDMKKYSRDDLLEIMGKWGSDLYGIIRGIDERPVVAEAEEAKSIGEQETFAADTREPSFLLERLNAICAGVHRHFAEEGFRSFRTVVATIRFADFETLTRSHTLAAPTGSLQKLQFEAMHRVMPFLDARENPRRKKIRLLGVRVEKLS